MKTILTSLVAAVVVCLLLLGRADNQRVQAQAAGYPLDPNSFTSLGASPFGTAGAYTIDASRNNTAPTLSGPGITTPIAGVFHSPSNGATARDEIAVFTFNSINIPANVTVRAARNANSRPIALLSKDSITIDGIVDVSGDDGGGTRLSLLAFPGGNAGPGGGGGGGGGGGEGSSDPRSFGVGGAGGVGFVNGLKGENGNPGPPNPGADGPGDGGGGGSVSPGGGAREAVLAAAAHLVATAGATAASPMATLPHGCKVVAAAAAAAAPSFFAKPAPLVGAPAAVAAAR